MIAPIEELKGEEEEDEKAQAAPPEEVPPPPEQEEEFYRKPRVVRRPNAPTKQEVEDHLPLHLPYRSWCDDCVEALGREWAHLAHDGNTKRTIPLISCDYFYATSKGTLSHSEFVREEVR